MHLSVLRRVCDAAVACDQQQIQAVKCRPAQLTKNFLMLGCAATLASCSASDSPEARRERTIEQAAGPKAMWYRFQFAAEYDGRPFSFDQYVYCGTNEIAGGFLGSAPAVTYRAMHPRTVGAKMHDGSYIVVRVPDMCQRYRKFVTLKDAQAQAQAEGHEGPSRDNLWKGSDSFNRRVGELKGRQPGWISGGPFNVLPMVVWNDRRPNTTRVEQYVARAYYEHPQARVKKPQGKLELMPVGFHPANYLAVLDQKEWSGFDPDENLDPGTGQPFRNIHAHNSNGFRAFYIVPTVDMAAALARLDEPPEVLVKELDVARLEAKSEQSALDQMKLWLKNLRKHPKNSEINPTTLTPVKDFNDPRFRLYIDKDGYEHEPLSLDPRYLPPRKIAACINELKAGSPFLSDFSLDLENPRERTSTEEKREIDRAFAREGLDRRRRNEACTLLNQLKAFDIVDGRLSIRNAIPGVIVRQQWHWNESPTALPSRLEREGVALRKGDDRFANYYKIDVADAHLNNVPLRSERVILHDTKTDLWYVIFSDSSRVASDQYSEGGW